MESVTKLEMKTQKDERLSSFGKSERKKTKSLMFMDPRNWEIWSGGHVMLT